MRMWRFYLCVVALLAAPALAPEALALSLQYDEDHSLPRHNTERYGTHHHARRHPNGLSAHAVDPYRMGPAPTAFLYHCDAPAGFYPYVPTCRMPWRIVPAGAHR
jgi:hypothetical protein